MCVWLFHGKHGRTGCYLVLCCSIVETSRHVLYRQQSVRRTPSQRSKRQWAETHREQQTQRQGHVRRCPFQSLCHSIGEETRAPAMEHYLLGSSRAPPSSYKENTLKVYVCSGLVPGSCKKDIAQSRARQMHLRPF